MPGRGSGMTWDAAAHAKLFAAFIKVHDIKPINYNALAQEMGPGCTPKAITHVIAKIRAQGGADSGSTPSTPLRTSHSVVTTPSSKSNATSKSPAKITAATTKKRKDRPDDSEVESENVHNDYCAIDGSDGAETPAMGRSNARRFSSVNGVAYTHFGDSNAERKPSKKVKLEEDDDEV